MPCGLTVLLESDEDEEVDELSVVPVEGLGES